MMRHPKVVAWGECGLDYSDRSRGVDKKVQKDVLRRLGLIRVEILNAEIHGQLFQCVVLS